LADAGFRGGIMTVYGVGYRFVALAEDRAGRRAEAGRG
jgi:hypothetical protein